MWAPESTDEPDGVGVLGERGRDDLLGGLVQTGVDDLHAGVPQGPGHHLRAAVVAVQSRLAHHDAQRPPGRIGQRVGHIPSISTLALGGSPDDVCSHVAAGAAGIGPACCVVRHVAENDSRPYAHGDTAKGTNPTRHSA